MGPHVFPEGTVSQQPSPWVPPDTHPLLVNKGSVFHLRYLFDDYACFPRRFLGFAVRDDRPIFRCRRRMGRRRALSTASICGRLLDPQRSEVLVTPLYLDREHPARDQIRTCRLPRGQLVDSSVALHWIQNPRLADFMLGFWNSAVTNPIVCQSLLSHSCSWLTSGLGVHLVMYKWTSCRDVWSGHRSRRLISTQSLQPRRSTCWSDCNRYWMTLWWMRVARPTHPCSPARYGPHWGRVQSTFGIGVASGSHIGQTGPPSRRFRTCRRILSTTVGAIAAQDRGCRSNADPFK